jgi:DNA helicase-2/ATP-dependent DNA helicase PcrA
MTGSEYRRNPAQEEAVSHTAGPLRILAGAGSGKTTTLVRRISALLEAGLCRPAELLMLTFTNKAVADMRRQVAEKLPAGSEQPCIETYHAFALALVREFAPDLGLPPEPALLTEGPVRLFVRRHFDRLGIAALDLGRLDAAVSTALDFFSWHRHEGTYLLDEDALMAQLDPAQHDTALIAELLAAHRAYRALLREQGAADYDDLIALAVQLLEERPAVRQEIQSRYRFMLVDEYQDTDHLQGRMIQRLAGEGQNITVVGDPDQTIYSFRGAAASNILDFPMLFPGTREIAMVTNYRSTPAIVAAANAVIANNTRGKEQPLVADRPQADLPRPQLVEAPDWPSEARWMAREIRRLHDSGAQWSDVAVLVRGNKHKLPLYAALVEAGIPARVIGGMDLFADAETARFIAYLRALAAPDADGDLSVALGLPRYGLTDADIARLGTGRQYGERLIDTVARLAADPGYPAHPALKAFLAEFWPLFQLQHTEGYEAAIRGALALHAGAMGLQARLNADQLLPLARGFFAQVRLLADEGTGSPMALFCQYLQSLREAGEPPEGVAITETEDVVTLMTVHAAKGLQFPVVFLPRLTASDFHPKGQKKWDKPFPLAWHHDPAFAGGVERMTAEEERRLFYVAVTRAMDRLYLSWAPADPARVRPLSPTQFLAELGDTCDCPSWDEVAPDHQPAPATQAEQPDLTPHLEALLSREPARPQDPAEPGAFKPRVPAVLSFTHLSTYQTCPYRFYLQYLLHLPGRPAHTADAGIRIHAAIERLAEVITQGAAVTYDEFTAWAAALPPPDPDGAVDPSDPAIPDAARPGADEPEGEGRGLPAGGPDEADALQHFWASEYGQIPPIAAEQEFYLPLGGAVVRGFIDRIHRRPNGTVEVVDFKTYNHVLTESQVRQSLQLPLYIRACREALHLPVSTGAMYFLKHDQTVRVTYTEEELVARLREAESLVGAIRKGDWAPTPGAVCNHCPYGELCPVSRAT